MSNHSEDRAAEMRELFLQSAQELLQSLNEQGLNLETGAGDGETMRDVRRIVHTLKGDAAAVGFRELSELAHEMEDALAPAPVNGNAKALPELVLSAADMFDAMLAAYRAGLQPPSGDPLRALIAKIAATRQVPAGFAPAAKPEFAWSEYQQLAIAQAAANGQQVFNIAICFSADCPMRAAGAELVRKTLREAGELLAFWPEESKWASADKLEFAIATGHDEAWITAKCQVPGVVASVLVQGAKTPEKSAPAMAEATAALGSKSAARAQSGGQSFTENVLRVDAERIDAILNLIGELVIAKSALHQTLNEFSRRFPKDPLRTRLSDAIGFQSQVLNALQRAAMKIRMVPVEHLFRRFPRLVRDLAHRCEKNVTIDIAGQDTDLDKGLLDAITEPLAHLVRNAVDHGIETPAERRAADKPEQGTLRLNAFHQGNQVVIEVSDDGRGIDGRRVLARAVEQGLLTSEQASRLTAADVLDLIFEQGFSTADEITEISGRGVGMDAVKTAVQKLKGTISLETQPGRGTCFQIKLPLTLAILRGMLFRVNDRLYAVPLDSVAEITRAAETDIARVENREVLQLRNEVLTIVRLSRLEQAPEEARTGKLFVLVISAGQRKFGLVVDRLVGEEELVIKPLDDKIVASDLVSGASVLGDGSVVMILNVGELVRRFGTAALPSRPPASQGTTWGATA